MSRKSPEKPQKSLSEADVKARRLAEALRANLKRRKAADRPAAQDTAGKPETAED